MICNGNNRIYYLDVPRNDEHKIQRNVEVHHDTRLSDRSNRASIYGIMSYAACCRLWSSDALVQVSSDWQSQRKGNTSKPAFKDIRYGSRSLWVENPIAATSNKSPSLHAPKHRSKQTTLVSFSWWWNQLWAIVWLAPTPVLVHRNSASFYCQFYRGRREESLSLKEAGIGRGKILDRLLL